MFAISNTTANEKTITISFLHITECFVNGTSKN